MYKIITLAAAASLLTLAACNRDTETAPAGDDAAANADAMAADGSAADAATRAPAAPPGAAAPSGSGTGESEAMAPAGSSMADPTGSAIAPATEETRANAQRAAEETNLHPKPPMN